MEPQLTATRSTDAHRETAGSTADKPDAEEEPEFSTSDLDTVELELSSDDTVIMRTPPVPAKSVQTRTKASHPVPKGDCPVALIKCVLRAAPYGDLDRVEVHRQGDTLRLSGRLPSFFLKQTAQELARREISGSDRFRSMRLINAIEVLKSTSANGLPR